LMQNLQQFVESNKDQMTASMKVQIIQPEFRECN
jgi:hypothetical protein